MKLHPANRNRPTRSSVSREVVRSDCVQTENHAEPPAAEPFTSESVETPTPSEAPQFWEIDITRLTFGGMGLILFSLLVTGLSLLLIIVSAFALSMALGFELIHTGGMAALAVAASAGLGLGSVAFRSGWRWLEQRGMHLLRSKT